MSDPMTAADALELCELRIKEDKISAGTALKEFRDLTGFSLRGLEPLYQKFKKMEQQAK